MDTECLSFADVPGASRLFLNFLQRNPQLQRFYPTAPRTIDELAAQAGRSSFDPAIRAGVAAVLERQNRAWQAGEQTIANIERLRCGACAIVTGQQVGLFLGPAYTLYKAITAVRIASDLTSRGVDAVPVFWMASEDHDLAEVNHVYVPDASGELQRLQTTSRGGADQPVGSVVLDEDVAGLVAQLTDVVGSSPLLDAVAETYRPGRTFTAAFALLMTKLFSQFGLILLDPANPELHKLAQPTLESAAAQSDDLNRQLLARDQELEAAGYHAQVKVANSSTLLFYVKDNRRLAVHRKEGHFSANGERWSPEQLRDVIEKQPDRFSGNALLRPIVQDSLLPTATYVGGPAEIAYFAQSQVLYQNILGRVTPIWPRFSATLIEARLASWMRKYGLHFRDILQPKQKLLTALASRTMPANLKEDFDRSRELLERMFSLLLPSLQKLDPTVASAAEVAARKMQYQMEKLESSAARSQLDREQVIGRHGAALSAMLFPESQLQERTIPGIYFLCKHGPELLDQLIESYRPECQDHQAIAIG